MSLGARVNLVICQKSKISDWYNHLHDNYSESDYIVLDITDKNGFNTFMRITENGFDKRCVIGVINYELVWRRPSLSTIYNFTLMLDESSLIQNTTAKRTKFILSLKAENIILLSGTPTGGKYENLYSQLKLLGYKISKKLFYDSYIEYHYDKRQGFPLMIIDGYKNVERLKRKMREYGCHFLKTEEVMDLPEQRFIPVRVDNSTKYKYFMKNRIVAVDIMCREPKALIGDTALTKLLYARMLCGAYSDSKMQAFTDLLESTSDRLIVFYNFNSELDALRDVTRQYTDHISIVNGKTKDLTAYEEHSDSVTFIQYQAGAMGLNLQKANKIIYFTPPLSSELYEQSKKRIHRINQHNTCTYYQLTVKGSVEEHIYETLAQRKDYTDKLFEEV